MHCINILHSLYASSHYTHHLTQVEHVDRILTHGGKTEELLWNDLQVKVSGLQVQ
jgi:hypothetical protein